MITDTPIIFTRATTAYTQRGISVPAGTPRYEGGRFGKGIVKEEGTFNILSAVTPSTSAGLSPQTFGRELSPDGQSAVILNDNGAASEYKRWYYLGYNTSGTYSDKPLTFSVYIKKVPTATHYCKLAVGTSTAFNQFISYLVKVSDGTVVACDTNLEGATMSYTVTPCFKDWVRVSVTLSTIRTNANVMAYIYPAFNTNGSTSAAPLLTGAGTVIWNPQLEQKAYCTSYHPNTRGTDIIQHSSSMVSPTEGTIELWYSPLGEHGYYSRLLEWGDFTFAPYTKPVLQVMRSTSAPNNLIFYYHSPANPNTDLYASVNLGKSTSQVGKWYHVAVSWKVGEKLKLTVHLDGVKYYAESASILTAPGDFGAYPFIDMGSSGVDSECANCIIDDYRISNSYNIPHVANSDSLTWEANTVALMSFDDELTPVATNKRDYLIEFEAYNDNALVGATPAYVFSRIGSAINEDGTQAATGIPRLASGKFGQAIMVENETTNLLLYSNDYSSISWARTNVSSVTKNQPDHYGVANNAWLLLEDTSVTMSHYIHQLVTKSTSVLAYTFTIYVKKHSEDFVWFGFSDAVNSARAWVNLNTGAALRIVTGTFSITTLSALSVGNGWFKLSMSITSTTLTSLYCQVGAARASGSVSFTGDSVKGIIIGRAQLEQKSYGTTYVETTSSTATRNKEVLFVPIVGTLSSSKGTIECWVKTPPSPKASSVIFDNNSVEAMGRIALVYDGATQAITGRQNFTQTPGSFSVPRDTWVHVAATWSSGAVLYYANGNLFSASSEAVTPNFDALDLGVGMQPITAGNQLNGLIDDLRLSNIARSSQDIKNSFLRGTPAPYDEYTTALYNFNNPGLETFKFCTGTGVAGYIARVLDPGSIKLSMFASGKTSGASQVGFGEIRLINDDGVLDYLLDYGVSGRAITVKEVTSQATTTIYVAVMEQMTFTDKELSIRIKDPMSFFNQNIPTAKFLGTNTPPDGVEGDASLKDRIKPKAAGVIKNASVIRVNDQKCIYSVGGSASEFLTVYDKRVPLTFGTAYTNQALFEAAPTSPGCYDTYYGQYFKLGSSPSGTVTADFVCSATATDLKCANMAKIFLTDYFPTDAAFSIDSASFTSVDTELGYGSGGYYAFNSVNQFQAVDAIAASIGLWYGFTANGVLRAGLFKAPSGTPDLSLSKTEIVNITRQATQDEGKGVPVYKVTVNYDKNWTVQDPSSLAGATSAERWSTIELGLGEWNIAASSASFVAIKNYSNVAKISTNGLTWTSVTLPISGTWLCIGYGAGLFIAMSAVTTNYITSDDNGATWTLRTMPVTCTSRSIAYGSGYFIMADASTSSKLWYSTTGTSWTSVSIPDSMTSIAYGGGTFVAVSDVYSVGYYSTNNGASWTSVLLPATANGYSCLAYGNGLFVALVDGTSQYITSPDGITWMARTMPVPAGWSAIVYAPSFGEHKFIATAYLGYVMNRNVIAESFDGVNWVFKELEATGNAARLANAGGLLVGVYGQYGVTINLNTNYEKIKEWLTVSVEDTAILTKHPKASEIVIDSLLTDYTDALAEANRQLTLRKVRRDYIAVLVHKNSLQSHPVIGSVVKVTYPRYGYDSGKLFLVIGVTITLSNDTIELSLWG